MKQVLIQSFLLFAIMGAVIAHAGELEFLAGANSTTYDQASDANAWGLSLRLQYNFSRETSGWIINLNAPGISLLAGQLHLGYLWRTTGDFYWEGGLAAGYGLIFGPDATLIGGFGYRVTSKFFFDFPMYVGTLAIAILPNFGFEF